MPLAVNIVYLPKLESGKNDLKTTPASKQQCRNSSNFPKANTVPRDCSLFIPHGGTEEKLKKYTQKHYPTALGVQIFFTQLLIEIQDFKAAFVNLTRSDCFICFCYCYYPPFHITLFFTQTFGGFKNQ